MNKGTVLRWGGWLAAGLCLTLVGVVSLSGGSRRLLPASAKAGLETGPAARASEIASSPARAETDTLDLQLD